MEYYRVIIAGGREFNDYQLLKEKCDNILATMVKSCQIVILSGTAKGADKLGEQYAQEKGYTVEQYPADWNSHGKKAGIIRNAQMANSAQALIAFWDGKSRGTKNMIEVASSKGLAVRVVNYPVVNK